MPRPHKRMNHTYTSEKFKSVPCVIGIDQSYKRTGISIAVNGKLKKITSVDFQKVKYKPEKRRLLREKLSKAIEVCMSHFSTDEIVVIYERIRTITQTDLLNPTYIKATGALCAVIIDTAFDYGIECWSVDTRAWKSGVLGTSKPCAIEYPGVTDPKKILDVKFIVDLGFGDDIIRYKRIKKGSNRKSKDFSYDDDAADSACIALYGFVKEPKLKKEM